MVVLNWENLCQKTIDKLLNTFLGAKLLQSCAALCNLMDFSLPGSSVHGDSLGKNTGVGCPTLLQGIFAGIEPRFPALQEDSLPSEPPGKTYIYIYI